MKGWLKTFLDLCWQEKKWLLIPSVLLLLLLIGAILLFASGSGISWALYPSR